MAITNAAINIVNPFFPTILSANLKAKFPPEDFFVLNCFGFGRPTIIKPAGIRISEKNRADITP